MFVTVVLTPETGAIFASSTGVPLRLISPEYYEVDIAGETTSLPMLQLNDQRAIALLMDIEMGLAFGDRVGKALAARFEALKPEVVVGSATLGIPVAMDVSRHLGLDKYVILQKSPKFHLDDALEEPVRSITTDEPQRLLLDRRQISTLQGRRVVIVDDVIATGASMAGAMRLVRRAGAKVLAVGTILTEGNKWREALAQDVNLVKRLGHIPQFSIVDGEARVEPTSLDPLTPSDPI
ncbi:phosphoribosyltransferase family protein [Pacificibacter marinus]|uniref:phosphoribosyltransferase family protein n=1 Tax=Pacificibacter marinus TaxID=658057 RepID=UPI0020901A6C|nr:phosphoribosyltransferase family protein [Pacificibacter marinus]